jgi:hypothetical protein
VPAVDGHAELVALLALGGRHLDASMLVLESLKVHARLRSPQLGAQLLHRFLEEREGARPLFARALARLARDIPDTLS